MSKAITAGAAFEKQMSAVSAFVRGADANMMQLTQTAKDLGKATTFSAVEAGQAMVELGKAGFDAAQVMAAVPAVLTLAQAGSLSMADAASIAGSTLKQFQLDASETTNVVDALAAAASSGNLDVASFGTQMGFASGGAQALGMNVDETAAALAFLADGVTSERMGRSFDAMATAITSATPAAQAAMSELGVSVTDAEGQFKKLPDIIDEFNVAFAGMSPENKERQLGKIFNATAIRGFRFAMNQGGDALRDVMDTVADNEGFGLAQSQKMVDNLTGSFDILGSAATNALIEIAETFQTDLKAALTETSDFINGLTDMLTTSAGASGGADSLADSFFGMFLINAVEVFDWVFTNWSNLWRDLVAVTTTALSNISTNLTEVFGALWEVMRSGGTVPFEANLVGLTEGFKRTTSELRLSTADEVKEGLALMGDEVAEASEQAKGVVTGTVADLGNLGPNDRISNDSKSDEPAPRSPLGVALKGSREAFHVVNKAIKGTKEGHMKLLAKQSEKQTKLAEKQVSLLEGIAEETETPEVFSFA